METKIIFGCYNGTSFVAVVEELYGSVTILGTFPHMLPAAATA